MKSKLALLFLMFVLFLMNLSLAVAGKCGFKGCEKEAGSICTQCRTVEYCSVDHQRKSWNTHRPDCIKTRNELSYAADSIRYPQAMDILTRISEVGLRPGSGREVRSADGALGARYLNLGIVAAGQPAKLEILARVLVGDQRIGVNGVLLEREGRHRPEPAAMKEILEERLRQGVVFILKQGGEFEVPFENISTWAAYMSTSQSAFEYLNIRPHYADFTTYAQFPENVFGKEAPLVNEITLFRNHPGAENIKAILAPKMFEYSVRYLFPQAEVIPVENTTLKLRMPPQTFGYHSAMLDDLVLELENVPDYYPPLLKYLGSLKRGSLIWTHATRLSDLPSR